MAQTYANFPSQFNRNVLRELDLRFWVIFLVLLVVYVSLIMYMKSIPYVPDIAVRQKLLQKLYRVSEVTTEISVTYLTEIKEQKKIEQQKKEEEERIEKVEETRAERAKITDEERKARRVAARKARAEKAASLKQRVSKMNVFAAAGSKRGAIGKGSSGRGGGRKFSNIVGSNRGIAGSGASLRGGQKFITGGAIADESADIEIVEGGAADIEAGEIGGGLEIEEIQEVKGEGAADQLRSPETLNTILYAERGRIARCFERYKKRDPQLNGRILLSFTILPDGSVTRISIESNWSNLTLGAQVDECIRRRVERWKFDPIDKGEVKLELPMSFY